MKVAIIDDVQMNVVLLKALVQKLPDVEPVCFTDPQMALDWCLANDPDLVVVDFLMPGINGTELTQKFRAHYPETPVLMVTANHEMSLRHQALELGVTDFLNKPIDHIEFLARAKNLLALSKSHKHLAQAVRKATAKLVEQERETIFCLARAAEYRDPATGAHILRMALYAKHIAKALGLSQAQQDLLLQTSPMHDIGKVATPDMILLKPGKLTTEEFAVMKLHASIGFEILSANSSPMLQVAAEIAYTHHEKWDGNGYPRGLKGDNIPLFGRIVAIADVFDALTSVRPYKQAWSVKDASDLLHTSAGNHFDPACVDAFFTDFDEILTIKSHFADAEMAHRDESA